MPTPVPTTFADMASLTPGSSVGLNFGGPRCPRAVPGTWVTAELSAPDVLALHNFAAWAAQLFGDPERVLAIRLDEDACMAELDFGTAGSGRPVTLH